MEDGKQITLQGCATMLRRGGGWRTVGTDGAQLHHFHSQLTTTGGQSQTATMDPGAGESAQAKSKGFLSTEGLGLLSRTHWAVRVWP